MTDSAETRPAENRVFLIADIRGYTKYTDEHGDEAAGSLAARFAELSNRAVSAYDGVLLELRGDEALAHFASARQALRAAVELQRLVADEKLPRGVGVGIDAGEAVPVAGGYRGTALNLAARLCSQAGPGQILATETVVHLAGRIDTIRYSEPRAVRLKGFDAPMRIIGIAADDGSGVSSSARSGLARVVTWRPLATAVLGTTAVAVVVVLLALLARPAAVATGPTASPGLAGAAATASTGSTATRLPSGASPNASAVGASGALSPAPGASAVVPSAVPAPPPGDWPMFRGGAARTGLGDAGPTAHPIVRWQYQAAGSFVTAPAVVGDVVYAMSDDGILHALADSDGHQLWSAPNAYAQQGPTIADGNVYVFDNNNDLHALDLVSGNQRWQSSQALPGFLTAADGAVYISTAGAVVALDAASGAEKWRYTNAAAGNFNPPALADGAVYAGSDTGGLVALDATTGSLKWHADVAQDTTNSTAVVADGIVFLADILNPNAGHLTAFDSATGGVAWQVDEASATPAVMGGVAFSGSPSGTVVARGAASGSENWRFTAASATAPVVAAGGLVYVAALNAHTIYAFDGVTGDKLWSDDAFTGGLTPLAVTHGSIYVGSAPGILFALGGITDPASFVWQSQAQGLDNPGTAAVAPDGNIWVADNGNNRFAIFSPDGTFNGYWGSGGNGDGQFELRRSNGDGYGAVAFAPDGSFYVLDPGNKRIQHFGPDRKFLLSWGGLGTTPGKFTDPMAIAVDDKGLVHVLDDGRGVLETFDSKGQVVASFDPKLAGFNSANSVYLDASGDVYIAACCNAGNAVRKYDSKGNLLMTFGNKVGPGEFQNQPGQIAVDAAGHVFVASQGGFTGGPSKVVLVFDPDGQFVTSFGDTGTGDGQFTFASGLVLDEQGGIYVTDYALNRIQKFQLTGALTARP